MMGGDTMDPKGKGASPDILTLISETAGIVYRHVSNSEGGVYRGPCPWCGGRDRFSIYPERRGGGYICNQCGSHGDAIQFLKDYSGLSFKEACERLSIDAVDHQNHQKQTVTSSTWEPRQPEFPPDLWSKKAEAILFAAHKNLLSPAGEKIRRYLDRRGINLQTIRTARIGYNSASLNFSPESWGLDPLQKKIWIPPGILIPYFFEGRPVRIRIRQDRENTHNRYIVVPGSYAGYMVHPFKGGSSSSATCMVIESELDGWAAYQSAGDIARIMSIGNAQSKPDTVVHPILSQYHENVLCALDRDTAGEKHSKWWEKTYSAKYWRPQWDRFKDIGEAAQAGKDLRSWIESGIRIMRGESVEFEPDKLDEPENDCGGGVIKIPDKIEPDNNYHQDDTEEKFSVESVRIIDPDDPSGPQECRRGEFCIHHKSGRCLVAHVIAKTLSECPKRKWKEVIDPECDAISFIVKMPFK
jgi:hypothetical protein